MFDRKSRRERCSAGINGYGTAERGLGKRGDPREPGSSLRTVAARRVDDPTSSAWICGSVGCSVALGRPLRRATLAAALAGALAAGFAVSDAGAQPATPPAALVPAAAAAASVPATPGSAAGPTLAEAQAKLQAGDAAGARPLLEAIVAREPASAAAWRMLGTARLRLSQYAVAVTAFERALALEPGHPLALYNEAAALAHAGQPERAIAVLAGAKAARKLDASRLAGDEDFASLRALSGFKALLPVPADFADPFVEPVHVLREWDGEAAGDEFGWIARNLGDVDGDGVADVVVSAPGKDLGGAKAGRIYVYSTKSGRLLWQADGKPGDELGTGVEAAGDTDGDGIPDVVAGAPGGGYARVYSGRDGRILLTLQAEQKSDTFGRHTAGIGDVDHDGHADVLVGAPDNAAGGAGAGRATVFSGKDGKVLWTLTGERAGDQLGSTVGGALDHGRPLFLVGAPGAGPGKHGRVYVYRDLSQQPAFVIEADETGAALGEMFVAVAGDVDGDGVADVYASDWSNAAHGPSTGRVYVHSGREGRRLLTLTGETAGEGFGTSPSVAGDVDGDGHADLIVGAWQYAGAAVSGGRAYLYSGKNGSLLRTYTCKVPGDTFGFDAVNLGDVDGDGTVDFLITSGWSGVRGFHSGRVFVLSSGVRRGSPPAVKPAGAGGTSASSSDNR